MNRQEIQTKVTEILVDKLGIDQGSIKMESDLKEDFGTDSLDCVEIIMELESEFSAQGVPALKRLRAAMLTEELYAALRELDSDGGMLRCAFPAPRTMELQYRGGKGPLNPDLRMVQRLARNPCAEGVGMAFYEGRCVVTIS